MMKKIITKVILILVLVSHTSVMAGSFTANTDGTVTDNLTNLIWHPQENIEKMTWESAIEYCEGLAYASFNDWRLPNIKELESLTEDSAYNPAVDRTYFPNTYSDFFWSSTTFLQGDGYAWIIDFSNGMSNYKSKSLSASSAFYARCVR